MAGLEPLVWQKMAEKSRAEKSGAVESGGDEVDLDLISAITLVLVCGHFFCTIGSLAHSSVVPGGTKRFDRTSPTDESVGYFRVSLSGQRQNSHPHRVGNKNATRVDCHCGRRSCGLLVKSTV